MLGHVGGGATLLLIANVATVFLALSSAVLDLRLPLMAYVIIAAVQFASIAALLARQSLYSAIAGASITVLLVFAMLVEVDGSVAFGPWYPRRVYRPELVATAYQVLVVGGGLFYLVTLAFGTRARWPRVTLAPAERQAAGTAGWVLFGVGSLAALLTLGKPTIFIAPYPFSAYESTAIIQSSGLTFIAVASLGMSLILGVLGFGYDSRRFAVLTGLVLALVTWVFLLRGARGHALPVLVTAAFIPLLFDSRPESQRFLWLILRIVLLVVLFQLLGTYRWSASKFGAWEGFLYAWDDAVFSFFGVGGSRAGDILDVSTLPQSYWHLLQTIDLFESGNRLLGQTFVNVILQAVPLFIADMLGYVRPLSESAQLSLYRLHGGGMYALATAYWNFGLFGVALFSILLGLLANWMEAWFRRQTPLVIGAYLIAAGTLPYGMLYGWQSLARGLQISLVLALLLGWAAGRSGKRVPAEGLI